MPTYQLLTDRTIAQSTAITPTTLIHIVTTADTTQSIYGSSFKVELRQLSTIFKDTFVTGGTYSSGTATFTNSTGGTFNVTGFFTGNTDIRVTGATYSNNSFTYRNNTGGTFSVLFNTVTGLTTNGNLTVTGTTSSNTISATTYQNLPTDVRVTGGTYSNNSFTYRNNTGGTFSVLFNTVTGLTSTGTISSNTISATTYQNLPTDIRVTGGTYSAGTILFTNNTGGTFNVTGLTTGSTSTISGNFLPLSGGTVTGNTIFTSGLTANTISATTYQNLPTDIRVTGATYSNNIFTHTNNTGGTYSVLFNTVTGLTSTGTISSNTVSATTYQNLPTDIRVTGSTYSNNTFTSTNNTGGTYSVLFNTVTGLTVNGDLSVTGNTGLGTTSANTILELYGDNGSTLRNVLRFTDSDTTVGVVPQFIGKLEFNGNETSGTGVKCFIGGIQNSAAQGSLVFGTTGTTGSLTGGTLTSTERMRIDSDGNVGINDTTPSYRLEVSSGVESVDEVVSHFRNDASKGLLFIPVANNDSFNFNTTSGDTVLVSTTGQPLVIGSKDGAAFRFSGAAAALSANTITTGNRLGIGSVFYSSTEQPSEGLDVNGSARFRAIGSTASAGALHYTANGTLTTNTSDQRLKENIEPLTNSLSNVLKLSGVTYNWIGIEGKRVGFIAQEVEKVIPELVFTNNNTEEKYKGIHQDNMVAVLVESIKEQQEMIEDLKAEITNLKLRITNLES